MARKATTYNKILGVTKENSIVVLNDIFEYEDGFKGATHFQMEAVPIREMESRRDDLEEDFCLSLWKHAVETGETTASLQDFIKDKREYLGEDELFIGDDPSYRAETERIVSELPKEKLAKIHELLGEDIVWDCINCGRMGDSINHFNFIEVFEPELIAKVKEVENV